MLLGPELRDGGVMTVWLDNVWLSTRKGHNKNHNEKLNSEVTATKAQAQKHTEKAQREERQKAKQSNFLIGIC